MHGHYFAQVELTNILGSIAMFDVTFTARVKTDGFSDMLEDKPLCTTIGKSDDLYLSLRGKSAKLSP